MRLFALVLAFVSTNWAVVGEMQLWMAPGEALSATLFNRSIWIASSRGIYTFDPQTMEQTRRWNSIDGLAGVSIASLQEVNGELYALSTAGEVMRYLPNRSKFEIINSSWAAAGLSPSPGVVAGEGSYLFFGSGERVAIFDTESNRTELTVERLSGGSVQEIHTEEDGLWVLLDSALWSAPFNWDSLGATYDKSGKWVNHSDPSSWKRYPLSTPPPYRSVKRQKDLSWHGDSLAAPHRLTVDGTDFSWDRNALCKEKNGEPSCVSLGGENIGGLRLLMLDGEGNIWGWGEPWVWSYSAEGGWHRAYSYNPGISGTLTVMLERWIRPVSMDAQGGLSVGSWGKGVMRIQSDGSAEKWLLPESGSGCPESFAPTGDPGQPHFSVVPSVLVREEATLFSWWKPSGAITYGLGWWDGNEVKCQTVSGTGEPYTLFPDPFEENLIWTSHALGVQKISLNDKLTSLTPQKNYPSGLLGAVTGMAIDSKGRKWVTGRGGIGVICDENGPEGICASGVNDSLVRADLWLGLPDGLYTVVKHDQHGHLWIGTWGAGLIRLDVSSTNLTRSSWKRWGRGDGLPSDEIYDIAVDSRSGALWVSTSMGVVRLETAGRDRTSFGEGQTPAVYPNPFNPKESNVVRFDYLPEGASVALYSRSNRLIRRWSGKVLAGGLLEWDGRDRSGNLLQPGVYNWVVSAPRGSWKGRLLLVY